MSKVFIVAAKRTATGAMMGSLKNIPASDFGAEVVKQLIADTKIDPKNLDEVIVGNILPAGAGQGIGRQVAIKAGVPQEVPGYAISMACGSAMKALMTSFTSIKAGLHNLVIAGGTESMTRAPYLVSADVRTGVKMGDMKMVDHMILDALTDAYTGVHMGITAENIAAKFNISREEQDQFAYQSQLKAIKAVDAGEFDDEIVPLTIKERKGEFVFARDEYPNRTTNLEKLGGLRAAFKKDGSVTAGNASGINDGASFLLVASEEAVKKYNLTPLVEVIGIGQGGVDPQLMGLGPVPAVANALKHAGLKLQDIDVIELNEAFAAQSIGVIKSLAAEHGVAEEDIYKMTNIKGGAIALGHPVGASGARITVTLIHLMKKHGFTHGLASLCIGGGMGTAVILKNVK